MRKEVKNTKKINKRTLVWGINIFLFIAVVFMGINQAGKGAEISKLENDLQTMNSEKQDYSENLLLGNSTSDLSSKSEELGFAKAKDVIYIDSIDSYASLLVQ